MSTTVISMADEYFIDITLSHSLTSAEAQYKSVNNGNGQGLSSEGPVYKTDLRAGYSFKIGKNLYIEPSVGWGTLGSYSSTLNINNIYSGEVAILNKFEFIKYGVFGKYNYLSGINIIDYNDNVKVADKEALSFGIKTILETKGIDIIFAYEYILPKDYKEITKSGLTVTNTNFKIAGSYLLIGIRARF
jgi:hypothetical protein